MNVSVCVIYLKIKVNTNSKACCYHVKLVVDVCEAVFDDEILHLHSAVRWSVPGHHVGDV